jgi:cytochrome P450
MTPPLPTAPPRSAVRSDLAALRNVLRNPSGFLLTLSEAAGDIAQFSAGPVRIVSINRADLAQQVLVEQADAFRKMPAVRVIGALTGNGLLINEDAVWRRHRRLAAPAFQHRRIAAYADTIAALAARTVASWQEGEVLDIGQAMKTLSLQIIGLTLFDTDFAVDAAGLSDDIEIALDFINRQSGRLSLPLLDRLTPGKAHGLAAIAKVDDFVRGLIRARRGAPGGHTDLLDMLMGARDEDGSGLSDDEVRDEAITLIVAGHETVATALTWTFHLLGQYRNAAERLRMEAQTALGERSPVFGDLERLPWALQVFKESLRLYPAAFVIGREARQRVTLGEFSIAPGTWVMICPYTSHRDPRVFADPLMFDPERFAAAAERALPRGAYLPFGGGPRICIGNQFALLEAQIILATIARECSLTPADNRPVGLRPMITLNPDRPILMRVNRLSSSA